MWVRRGGKYDYIEGKKVSENVIWGECRDLLAPHLFCKNVSTTGFSSRKRLITRTLGVPSFFR